MSERIVAFVENWVSENAQTESYPSEGDDNHAKKRADECRTAALVAGISATEFDGDLTRR
jgi:hypothetical protein